MGGSTVVDVNWLPQGDECLVVTLGIRNLFDKSYQEQGGYTYYLDSTGAASGQGFTEPGRNVRLDVTWKY